MASKLRNRSTKLRLSKTLVRVKQIKVILLDLDNTIYAYGPCDEAGKAGVIRHLNLKLHLPTAEISRALARARISVKATLARYGCTAASHSRFLYCQRAIELLTDRTDLSLTLDAEHVFWDYYFAAMKLRPAARLFLQKAKRSGKNIVVVTDMTAQVQFRKLVRLKIDHLIDYVVTSEEVGVEKPSTQPLLLALEKAHSKPSEAVMVGDDDLKDLAAANQLGIRSVIIGNLPAEAEARPLSQSGASSGCLVLRVKNYAELLELLKL